MTPRHPPQSAPPDLPSRILHRDSHVIILNKPAGLPVHRGPSGGPNLEDMLHVLRFGLPQPPGLAHRLDRDTSGCLVLGRHRRALSRLGRLFSAGLVEKTYWAVVEGMPPQPQGRIELALHKEVHRTGWRIVADPAGQRAVTDWRVLAAAAGLSLLELHPRTGRTHQIRVHCAELGCPLLGDAAYGATASGEPLHLHARAVAFPYAEGRPPIAATAPLPPRMAETVRRLGLVIAADPDARTDP